MDDKSNTDSKQNISLNEDQQRQNELVEKWANSSNIRKILLKGLPLILLLVGIPLTVGLVMQQQNINSNASLNLNPTSYPSIKTPTTTPVITINPTRSVTSTPSSLRK